MEERFRTERLFRCMSQLLARRFPIVDCSVSHRLGNSFDCNSTPAQNWVLERGPTKVKLFGTKFCLDAGTGSESRVHHYPRDILMRMFSPLRSVDPPDGTGMKIWECLNDLPAQAWNYGPDNNIFVSTSSRSLFHYPIFVEHKYSYHLWFLIRSYPVPRPPERTTC